MVEVTNLEDFFNEIETQEELLMIDMGDEDITNEEKEDEEMTAEVEKNVTTTTATAKVEKTNEVATVSNNWTYSLKEDKVIKFSEFDIQDYEFHPVYTPSKEFTKRFLIFCFEKEESRNPKKVWQVKNSMITSKYVIANLTKFIEELRKQISIEKIKLYHQPFSISYFGEAIGKSFKTFEKESIAQIFTMLTGIDSNHISTINTKIHYMISNKYDGSGSLRIDYVATTILNLNNNRQEKFNHYFALFNMSEQVNHTSQIKVFDHSVGEIEKKIEEATTILKTKTDNLDNVLQNISSVMRKEQAKKLNGYWEQLPSSMKNLYYLQLIASYCLDLDFNYDSYLKLRNQFIKK